MAKKTGRKNILCKVKRKDDNGVYVYKWNEPIEKFFTAIKLGMSNVKACEFAGFTDKTLYEWLAKGETDLEEGLESIYSEFCENLKKTRAECQAFHLQNIIRAGQNGNWQASAWILERVFRQSFAANSQDTTEDDKIEVVNDVPSKK